MYVCLFSVKHDERVLKGERSGNLFPKPVYEEAPMEQRNKLAIDRRHSYRVAGGGSRRGSVEDVKNVNVWLIVRQATTRSWGCWGRQTMPTTLPPSVVERTLLRCRRSYGELFVCPTSVVIICYPRQVLLRLSQRPLADHPPCQGGGDAQGAQHPDVPRPADNGRDEGNNRDRNAAGKIVKMFILKYLKLVRSSPDGAVPGAGQQGRHK